LRGVRDALRPSERTTWQSVITGFYRMYFI
jgi:hypothetical protein